MMAVQTAHGRASKVAGQGAVLARNRACLVLSSEFQAWSHPGQNETFLSSSAEVKQRT